VAGSVLSNKVGYLNATKLPNYQMFTKAELTTKSDHFGVKIKNLFSVFLYSVSIISILLDSYYTIVAHSATK
jgi:hypothetical protein